MAKAKKYTEDDIKVLKGLDVIRGKPGMYISTTDGDGLVVIVREPCDNVGDEFEAGRASTLHVELRKDGSVAVHDDGEGMPVGKHKTEKVSTLQVLTGMLHAGGKLTASSAYSHAAGTHGIGIKATNAMSKSFVVETCREGKWYRIEYAKGKLITPTHKIAKPEPRPFKKGTSVIFTPDMTCFDKGSKIKLDTLIKWCDTAAYFHAGFKIILDATGIGGEKMEFLQPDGIDAWIDAQVEKHGSSRVVDTNMSINKPAYSVSVAFTDTDGNNLMGYTNGLSQPDGGVHVATLSKVIYEDLKGRANKRQTFDRDSILDGMLGIINFKVDAPKFSGQTKDKLADTRFTEICEESLREEVKAFFDKNKDLVKTLITRACSLASIKADFKLAKKAVQELKRAKKSHSQFSLKVGKADKDVPFADREVILVEGDSACGGCVTGDTQVRLADGSSIAIEEMFYRSNRGERFYGLAYDSEDGQFHEVELTNTCITKWESELVKLSVGLGESYTFTLDHRILVKQGHSEVWKEAGTLEVGDQIVSLNGLASVERVEFLSLDDKVKVYDTHVPGLENYCLSNGMVIHNCRVTKYPHQVVVPLKGKILNVLKSKMDVWLNNEEIKTILTVIGYDPEAEDPLAKLECGKVILLSDSDPDGFHINTLELTLFQTMIPAMIEAGMVFAVKAPRYALRHKDSYYTALTLEEMYEKMPKGANKSHISYLKGWGEVDPEALRDIALTPGTRQLIRITPPTRKQALEFERLMGEEPQYRKELFNLK